MKKQPYLARPQETIRILKKYDFNFQKKYGQNFLINPDVLEHILTSSGIKPEDEVLEIGPGIGTLTQYLAAAAGRVTAVEIDHRLLPILEETLSGWDNIKIIQGDILDLPLTEILKKPEKGQLRVVANLPYYVTTPILMKLLEERFPVTSITVMVQKEVAERMKASPGGKAYGALSLAVQYYSRPRIDFIVPPHFFMPRPKVSSSIITLDLTDSVAQKKKLSPEAEAYLFHVIHAAFAQRRKTLANALSHDEQIDCGREEVVGALKLMGLDERIRGERLSLEQFVKLSTLLRAATAKPEILF